MSEKVSSFLGGWIVTNVKGDGLKPEGDLAEAKVLADKCEALAAGQEITRAELDAEVGDLVEHMRKALNIAQHGADVLKG